MEHTVHLPSKPKDEGNGIFIIEGLYPGFGHTLGNSLRRIMLSSLPGAAIVSIKIEGVPHEFATLEGVRESVMEIILNLKKVHFKLHGSEPQVARLKVSGAKTATAKDFVIPSQLEIANPDQYIAEISAKTTLDIEVVVEQGLGFVSRELITREKADIGTIAVDALFSPIRRVQYEVEEMRVGDRTDFNRLKFMIETNGTITSKEALEKAISTMIEQLQAMVGFQIKTTDTPSGEESREEKAKDPMKMKVEELDLSSRTISALQEGGIKTVAGLVKKSAEALKDLDGIGDKAVQEIVDVLDAHGLELKSE